MWKPSKKLATWILVILLAWNLLSAVVAHYCVNIWGVDGFILRIYDVGENGPYFLTSEIVTKMNEADNNPRMILTGRAGIIKITSSDNIQYLGFTLKKIGENVQVLETGESLPEGSSTIVSRYDFRTSLILPWLTYKDEYYFKNDGAFENLYYGEIYRVGQITYKDVWARWENLDYNIVNAWLVFSPNRGAEYSLWGPVHLVTVLGALVYVRKLWK
jgi:hypothetical protein